MSTGYNIIDLEYASKKGIVLTNVPAYSTKSVAQLVFGYILHFCNSIAHHSNIVHKGVWTTCKDFCFWEQNIVELEGKTLGLYGFGSISKSVAKIAQAFEQDLADALNNGIIAGAEIDVLSIEPLKADNPLIGCINCIITPYYAWASIEARTRLMNIAATNLKSFLNGDKVNMVNK